MKVFGFGWLWKLGPYVGDLASFIE